MSAKLPNVKKIDIATAINIVLASNGKIEATHETIETKAKGWGVKVDVTKTKLALKQITDVLK
jgi:hypothetical protein